MNLSNLSGPRFGGVFKFKPENAPTSIPFEFSGQTYWTTGKDLLELAQTNIKVGYSGILTTTPNTFLDPIGDHHDAVQERQVVFQRLAQKAQ